MGNSQSSDAPKDTRSQLAKAIDYIATNYILTQNFQDMEKLADPEYCNNLVVMTSNIIAKNLSDLDVQYLAQRMKDGVEINEMTSEKVIFFNKKALENMDVSNKTTKRRLCIGIAKHYVKAAHLFSAIVTTINPTYTYKDSAGSTMKASVMDKQDIPSGTKTTVKQLNICSERLNALINNRDFNVPETVDVTVKPDFCGMNYDQRRGRDKALTDEPGIPELERLYYDKYDYDQGGFTGMSDKMKQTYAKDVATFYTAFTGNPKIPIGPDGKPAVTKFSQIPLRDFHRGRGCVTSGPFRKGYTATLKNQYFREYALHIKNMMAKTAQNQDKLVAALNAMFTMSKDKDTGKTITVLDPGMSENKLQDLVAQTRTLIIDLYVGCENDFLEGVRKFEAIVEAQMNETSKEQIKILEESIQATMAESPSKASAESKDPVNDLSKGDAEDIRVDDPPISDAQEANAGEQAALSDESVVLPDTQPSSEETKADDGSGVKAMMNKPLENPLPKPEESSDNVGQQASSSQEETIKKLQEENKELRREQEQGLRPAWAPAFQTMFYPAFDPEEEKRKRREEEREDEDRRL